MKTLDDWLASSGSSSSGSGSNEGEGSRATVDNGPQGSRGTSHDGGSQPRGLAGFVAASNPSQTPTNASMGGFPTSVSGAASVASSTAGGATGRTPTTNFSPTSRSSRLDETRAKMEKLLGAEGVLRAQSPSPASPTSSTAPSANPNGNNAAATSHVPYGMTPVTGNEAGVTPTTGGGLTGSETMQFPNGPATVVGMRPVEVMVVDRGTQTVTTVGVQTDPEPPFPPSQPGVHFPAGFTAPSFTPVAGIDYTARGSSGRVGVDGRPYRQQFQEWETRQGKDANALREQLEVIQNSIDMLISRYNLPPPPSF